MKKIFSIYILPILFCVSLCRADDGVVKIDQLFTLATPTTWTNSVRTDPMKATRQDYYLAQEKEGLTFTPNINIKTEKLNKHTEYMALKEFADIESHNVKLLVKSIKDFHEVSSAYVDFAGAQALERQLKMKFMIDGQEISLSSVQYFTKRGGYFFLVTGIWPENISEPSRNEIKKVLNTFKFREQL